MTGDPLLSIVREAVKNNPALKYSFGVLGIVAIVAIIASFRLDYRLAVVGGLIVLFSSALVLLFSKLSEASDGVFRIPALVMLWFSLMAAIVVLSLLTTSVFFSKPLDLSFWLTGGSASGESPSDDLEDLFETSDVKFANYNDFDIPHSGEPAFIANWEDSLVIGMTSPNRVLISDSDDFSTVQNISISGTPSQIVVSDSWAYVSTAFPYALHQVDLSGQRATKTYALPIVTEDFESLEKIIDGQLPQGILSFTAVGDEVWVVASDSNNAVIYILDTVSGQYSVPPMFDEDVAFSGRDWQLANVGNAVFAIATQSVPSSLYRLEHGKYTEYGGHEFDIVSAATGVWSNGTEFLGLLTPENDVVGVTVNPTSIVPSTRYGTLSSIDLSNWIEPIAAIDGEKQFLAINESLVGSSESLWSTVFVLDSGVAENLGLIADAKVIDMEVFGNKIWLVTDSAAGRRIKVIDQE